MPIVMREKPRVREKYISRAGGSVSLRFLMFVPMAVLTGCFADFRR